MDRLEVDRFRADTPGCVEKTHLNNAGAALPPMPVTRAVIDYIEYEARVGGYEAQAASQDAISAAYESVANLLGAGPRNIAFTDNATSSFAQALSSIPFQIGDVILTTRNDYSSNQIQFLSLQKRFGLQVLRAPDAESGGVDIAAMATLIDEHKPRLVCVTHVPTNSGLVQDVQAIGDLCRDTDTVYMVDACQSVGQMPIDVRAIGCDFLSATSRKFLRGPRGCGFLYVSESILDEGFEPMFIDMHGADWIAADRYDPVASAQRFENWEFAWGLVLGTAAAANYAMSAGIEKIGVRVKALADKLRKDLAALDGVTVLHEGDGLCGIVTLAIDDQDPFELVKALRERRINTSAQGRTYAVVDYDALCVDAALRISPHYYNTEDEMDLVVAALEKIVNTA